MARGVAAFLVLEVDFLAEVGLGAGCDAAPEAFALPARAVVRVAVLAAVFLRVVRLAVFFPA
ncbi:MAG: hypothetical protein WDZ31_11225, partial [Phycisphaeraceae bacterium]